MLICFVMNFFENRHMRKKRIYATDDELEWFKLDNYSELKSRANRDAPNYILWRSIITDRVELLKHLAAGQVAYVNPLFDQIKISPLRPLGFKQSYSGPLHSTNTPTVKSLTRSRVHWLNEAMGRSKESDLLLIDEQLIHDGEEVFNNFAHVMINVRATDTQIIENFKAWLTKWRSLTTPITGGDYQTKINSWANAMVVPYMDLELFSLTTGKMIHATKKFELLLPQSTEEERDSQRRRLVDMKALVFTNEMALTIQHLAENEISAV